MKNYYETLSISPSSSTEQIKIAYTNAVLKIQGQPNFAFRFGEIQEAYDILSNPSTRKKFDDELLSFYTGQFVNHNTKAPEPITKQKEPSKRISTPRPVPKKDLGWVRDVVGVILIAVIILGSIISLQTCEDKKPVETTTPQPSPDISTYTSGNNQPTSSKGDPILTNTTPVIEPIPVPVESPFKGKHLSNGSSPFDECFGQGDYSGRASLLVKNGTSNEAIICLYDVNSGNTIRNEYVRKNASYSLSNIPQGSYNIRVLYGNDWNPNAPSPCGSNGFFDSDIDFSEKDGSVFFSDNESGTTRATYTLYAVVGGNSKSSKIDKSKFFKK